ncbi:hypothetical protein ACJX0J_041066, partial [Zea mays]
WNFIFFRMKRLGFIHLILPVFFLHTAHWEVDVQLELTKIYTAKVRLSPLDLVIPIHLKNSVP